MRFSTLAVVTAFAATAGAADVKKRVRRLDMRKGVLQRRVRVEDEAIVEDAMSMPDGAASANQEPANGRPHHMFPDMDPIEEINGWTGDGHGSAECSTKVIDDFESGTLDLNWNTRTGCLGMCIALPPGVPGGPDPGQWKVVTASEAASTGGCAPDSTRCAESGDIGASEYSYMERPVTFTKDVILEFNVYCVSMGMDHCSFYFIDGNLDEREARETIFNPWGEEDTEVDWDDLIAHYQVVLPPGTFMLGWEVKTDNWGGDSPTFMRVDNIKVTPLHCEEDTKTPTQRPSDNGHWKGDEHSDGEEKKPWGFWGHVFGH